MTKMTATEALRMIAVGSFTPDAGGNVRFSLEDARRIAREAMGLGERTTFSGRVRLNARPDQEANCVYELECVNEATGRMETIYVEGNTMREVSRMARNDGFKVQSGRVVYDGR